MTVCIAALYGDGAGAVLASDRMVTAHIPIGYEFEHSEKTKIVELGGSDSVYALVAGDVLRGNEILNLARMQLIQQGRVTASETAEIVRRAYQQVRLANIAQRELEPRGLDLNGYYGRHQQLSPQVVQIIDQALCSADLGVSILVAGSNGSKEGTHTVHTILNPGTIYDNSSIGHGAIGTGAPHALYSLIENSYSASMSRDAVVNLVEQAKKRSEVAPGVGKKTTTVVIPIEDTEEVVPSEETDNA